MDVGAVSASAVACGGGAGFLEMDVGAASASAAACGGGAVLIG